MRKTLSFGTLLLACSGLTAGTFTYNSALSGWTGVGYTPTTTYDFESASTTSSATSSLSLGGYLFTAPTAELAINASAPSWVGSGRYLMSYGSGNDLTITIPDTGIFALGFNIGCAFCGAGTAVTSITATDKDGNTYTSNTIATATNAPAAFWGISSTSALTSIQFNFGTSYFGVDNIISGGQAPTGGSGGGGGGTTPPSDTPEVATIVLTATGFALMARYRRSMVLPLVG